MNLINKRVAVTGSFSKLSRSEINFHVNQMGGIIRASVTDETALVIYGEGAGAKLTKAQQNGITCFNEEHFLKMVDDFSKRRYGEVLVQDVTKIVALQYTGDNRQAIVDFMAKRRAVLKSDVNGKVLIFGAEDMEFMTWTLHKGDWLVHRTGAVVETVFEDYFPDQYEIVKKV